MPKSLRRNPLEIIIRMITSQAPRPPTKNSEKNIITHEYQPDNYLLFISTCIMDMANLVIQSSYIIQTIQT